LLDSLTDIEAACFVHGPNCGRNLKDIFDSLYLLYL